MCLLRRWLNVKGWEKGMGKLIRNNQVQVAEVLPLYAKGTGQQGIYWVKSSLNIEIKKITGWRSNRKIDWYEDVFLLCYANHYIVERDKQNVPWVAQLMSFTRLMLMECLLFYIVKHEQFFLTYCHNLCLIYGTICSIELHVPVSLKFH